MSHFMTATVERMKAFIEELEGASKNSGGKIDAIEILLAILQKQTETSIERNEILKRMVVHLSGIEHELETIREQYIYSCGE